MNINNIPDLAPWIYNRPNYYSRNHPIYHPDSSDYDKYWDAQLEKIIYGCFVLDQPGKTNDDTYDPKLPGGYRYVVPQHYWYINYIFLQHLPAGEVTPITQLADLRDIDLYWFYCFFKAWGFSGFTDDDNYSCHYLLERYEKHIKPNSNITFDLTPKEKILWDSIKDTELKKNKKEFKKYVDPVFYLKQNFKKPLGKPLYTNPKKNLTDLEARGSGKQLNLDTKLRTKQGWIPLRDINVGDKVIGSDGKETTVTFKSIPEIAKYYRITLRDGRTIDACEDHQWKIFNKNIKTSDKYRVYKTKELFKSYYNLRFDSKHYKKYNEKKTVKQFNYAIPNVKPVELPEQNLPIDPYILGCLIGDGCLLQSKVSITNADISIIEYFEKWCIKNNYTYSLHDEKSKAITLNITDKNNGGLKNKNSFINILKDIGLYGKKSENKFIPFIYLNSSIEQRKELLKGLIDTDGYNTGTYIEYTTSSSNLSKDVQELVRSLGYGCSYKTKKTNSLDSNRISIFTNDNISKLDRKCFTNINVSKVGKSKWDKTYIVNIEPVNDQLGACISVDNSDNTYVIQDYIVTHNTYKQIAVLSHTYNTFGAKTVDEFWNTKKGLPICVGSADSGKSGSLLSKFEFSQNMLSDNFGAYTDAATEKFYPGFFHKEHLGTLNVGNEKNQYRHVYKIKKGNSWKKQGTWTSILHRTYEGNSEAFVGNRSILMLEDEFGLNENAVKCARADNNVMIMSGQKIGTAIKSGTGGNIIKVLGAKQIFYNGADYNYVTFPDVYENYPTEIGLFIPAYYVDSSFRDQNGNQNIYAAYEQEMINRKKLLNGNSTAMLDAYIIDNPLVHSEMFLSPETNIFPITMIREHRARLMSSKTIEKIASFGDLEYTDPEKTQVKWVPLTDRHRKPILNYDTSNLDGDYRSCIIIYEHPMDDTPDPTYKHSLYKMSTDPVLKDDGGPSMYSIFVYKGLAAGTWNQGLKETIVAEYCGRIADVEELHEISIKLATYYNLKNLPEINIPDILRYYKRRKKLHLLQPKPWDAISKIIHNPSRKYEFGIEMTISLIIQAEQLYNKWLQEKIGLDDDGRPILRLHTILSLRHLDELIIYDRIKNTDTVTCMLIIMLWIYQEELVPVKAKDKEFHRTKINEYFNQMRKEVIIHSKQIHQYYDT